MKMWNVLSLMALALGFSTLSRSQPLPDSSHAQAAQAGSSAAREEENVNIKFSVSYKGKLITNDVIGMNGLPEASEQRWDTRWGKQSLERFAALRDKNECIRRITNEIWSALYGNKSEDLRDAVSASKCDFNVGLKLIGSSGDPSVATSTESDCGLYIVVARISLTPSNPKDDDSDWEELTAEDITSKSISSKLRGMINRYEQKLAANEQKLDKREALKEKEDKEISSDPFYSTFKN